MGFDLNSAQPVSTKPILGTNFRPVSIQEWWEGESAFVYEKIKYSRKKVILIAANQDGGAHVADKVDRFYEALSQGANGFSMNPSNLEFNGEPPYDKQVEQYSQNAHFSLIRQFVHEFISSVPYFRWID